MIKHVVMWKMQGPSAQEKQEQAARAKAALQGLAGQIPGMLSLEVGVANATNADQSDVVLITTHADWAALEGYQKHPEHQLVAKLVSDLRVERRVVDFEL
jgi:hypothetical protein